MAEATAAIQEVPTQVNPEFSQYKPAIEHLLPFVENEGRDFLRKGGKTVEFGGEIKDKRFKVRLPHLRGGKHAFVGIVEITDPDSTTFSCVIRDKTYDAESYQELVKEHPIAKEYMPELYGIIGNWAVMEKLSGLELQELHEKLKSDPEFRSKCAENLFELIDRTTSDGLVLQDFNFIQGHNCMVNPETGKIRLIEQRNLAPTIYSPNESITKQLFFELGMLTPSKVWEPHEIDFAFKLMKIAFSKIKPQDLYVQQRVIGTTHPEFKEIWFIQNGKELSEEEYKKILGKPFHLAYGWWNRGYTLTFSPELIEAVNQGDVEKFKQTLPGKKFIQNISSRSDDPRAKWIILPDNVV